MAEQTQNIKTVTENAGAGGSLITRATGMLENFQKFSNASKGFRMHSNVLECVRMGPHLIWIFPRGS